MQISERSPYRLTVQTDQDELLGIRTGIPAKGFAAQRVSREANKGGMLVRDNRVELWPVRRLVQHQGEFYLAGPDCGGRTVLELIESTVDGTTEDPQQLAWLAHLLRAVALASHHEDMKLANVMTSLVTDDGAVLFLRDSLADQVNLNLPFSLRKQAHFAYRPETLHDADLEIFQAVAITYHVLTGTPLVTTAEDADRPPAFPDRAVPMRVLRPELNDRIVSLVEDALAAPAARDARALESMAREIEQGGFVDRLGEEEAAQRREETRSAFSRARRDAQRRRFMRTHWRELALALAGAVVLAIIPVRLIQAQLEPPSTAGLGPRQVAETFYAAWNDFDHELMSEILARGVGGEIVREVTNLFVMDRVQFARSWRSTLMAADEWIAEGRPEGRMPYGVADLTVELVSRGQEEARVRARYAYWHPDNEQRPDGSVQLYAARRPVTDVLTLSDTGESWEITAIQSRHGSGRRVPINLQR